MIKKHLPVLIALTFLFFNSGCASDDEILDSTSDPDAEVPDDSDAEVPTDLAKFSLTVKISPENSGSVNVSNGSYDEGTSIELEGIPNSIYRFKEWQGDVSGNSNPGNVLIDSDKNITAVFEFNDLDKTYVPDDNFERALIELGYDDVLDDYVLTSSINSIDTLDVFQRNISDLTGIEDFIALEFLQCAFNQLGTLDLSRNNNLISLYCSNNQLAELNVRGCDKLEVIYSSNNIIETLDLSTNVSLQNLYVYSNRLASLDVTNNLNLKILYCDYNQLQTIDLSENSELTDFHCAFNELSELDVSANRELIELKLLYNSLSVLDLSSNPNIRSLDCSYNQLESLNLKNGSNHEMPGLPQNPHDNFFGMRFHNNPSLACIQVDDEGTANSGKGPYNSWEKDDTAVYSETCD